MKIVAIVQARLGSKRLPRKVLSKIGPYKSIELLLKRLNLSIKLDDIVLATTVSKEDDELEKYVINLGYKVFRGSTDDVLKRYIDTANYHHADVIVRITGDCPFVDPYLVDKMIDFYCKNSFDYVSNAINPTYPDGLDVEIFSKTILVESNLNVFDISKKEHVTTYIMSNNQYKKYNFRGIDDYSHLRWTLDEVEDLYVLNKIFKLAKNKFNFNWMDLLLSKEWDETKYSDNSNIARNQGANMNTGQKIYKRAKKVIPGGTMLLSKRPEMFLPEIWPAYFSKTKGCFVWDLDKNKYIDMSIMGIGTNILGYNNPKVDEEVKRVIKNGNMSTFNAPEEVYLAEKLVNMHPWSNSVRFARSGGEANSIAIRIARAASGKDKIAVCGYHGWHDWYLSVNIDDKNNLQDHLLPGLYAKGVPKVLKDTVFPFQYSDFETLQKIVKNNDLAAIKMEVSRTKEPDIKFLQLVRNLADQNGIILIFDECTSGFRQSFGGLHKSYGVNPDMAMFGKALGNGYAVNAILGKKNIMDFTQTTFISSTFWTERIGSAAALKTLEVMEDIKSWNIISEKGKLIKQRWNSLSQKYSLPIKINGLDALPIFNFESENHQMYKTYITQEMLKKGFLATNTVYVSIAHTDDLIEKYFTQLDKIFKRIAIADHSNEKTYDLLDGEISHNGFSRLN